MRIVVAGGSGFLGRPLIRTLKSAGHDVTQLVRRPVVKPDQLRWDPAEPVTLPEDTAAVINLCGVNIGHRWTPSYRRELRDSRVVPTTTLAKAVAAQGIELLINSSGVGSYGDTGQTEVTEESPALTGEDFLSRLSVEWEGATRPAADAGARVVLMRTGLPLSTDGGFLKPQLLPFKLGVGGKLGDGKQWVPWVSFIDWLRAVQFVIGDKEIDGPLNIVGPNPVTNAQFTKELGKALHRPTFMFVPKVAVRVLYGEYANEGYRSLRVKPQVLLSRGFRFEHATVDRALRAALSSR
ncbi:hypothetical protein Rhe02_68350 [Rhizocola hellebori]|uniref:TIGR01777 family protein n=1 Tax=Rhizocola hellebori TaxID=1392758 RepID=A0A8J3QFW3_9ACTN|nr:TIGR01777 family oxidoreductase [Rhizocola hellebori]GIH08768.1 hypothetical protein Rhe02_68350 [Rhizocola hellebori]